MKTLALRLASTLLGASLGASAFFAALPWLRPPTAGAGCCADPAAQELRERLREEAPRRNARIVEVLERRGNPEWAGEYRTRGRWPMVLRMAPGAGYSLYEHSWCGSCAGWRGVGEVVAADADVLTLEVELGYALPAPGDRPAAWFSLEPTLHLVRWGDLVFAVPPWRMERFCAELSDGRSFPIAPFRYVGEEASFDYEHPARPEGLPRVPSRYEGLVLKEPIGAIADALVAWRLKSAPEDGGPGLHEAVYSIGAGAEDGVVVGVRFFLEEREYPGRSGRVEHVESGSCRVVFVAPGDERAEMEALVGTRASTRHPGS